jgi:hypothetical protein
MARIRFHPATYRELWLDATEKRRPTRLESSPINWLQRSRRAPAGKLLRQGGACARRSSDIPVLTLPL